MWHQELISIILHLFENLMIGAQNMQMWSVDQQNLKLLQNIQMSLLCIKSHPSDQIAKLMTYLSFPTLKLKYQLGEF